MVSKRIQYQVYVPAPPKAEIIPEYRCQVYSISMTFSTSGTALDYLECIVNDPNGQQVSRLRVNNPAQKTHSIFPLLTYINPKYTTQDVLIAQYIAKWKVTGANALQQTQNMIITDFQVLPTLPDTESSRSYTRTLANGSYKLTSTVTLIYYRFPDPIPPIPPVPPVPDEEGGGGDYVIQINALGQSVANQRRQFYTRFIGSLYRQNR